MEEQGACTSTLVLLGFTEVFTLLTLVFLDLSREKVLNHFHKRTFAKGVGPANSGGSANPDLLFT